MKTTEHVKHIGNREYIAQLTTIFDTVSNQETKVVKINTPVKSVKNINWAVGSTGFIKLEWQGFGSNADTTFAVLSGNGRWELGELQKFDRPENSTGRILVSTMGFAVGDTYTLVLNGNLNA